MRSPPRRLERTLVLVLAGFIAVDLLLIVPALASELRLDRLHPSLPIVNLRPLAAGRARIADGLGGEFTAPIQAIAGDLQQAGAKALNAILYEEDAAPGNPSEPTEAQTKGSGGGIEVGPSYTPTSTGTQIQLDPSMTPSQVAVLTATLIHTASPAPTWQATLDPTFTPTMAASATPSSTAAPPTAIATSTPIPTYTRTAAPPVPQEGSETYYVATNGNDSSPGTKSEPFRTIKKGISILGPGDVLYVRGGTYVESLEAFPSGESWNNHVALLAYPGEDVTIRPNSGSDVLTFANVHHIIVDGFHLDGTDVEYNVINISAGAHHIRIQNTEVSGAPRQGILSSVHDSYPSGHNEFVNLNVHDNGTTDFDHGIYIETSNNVIHRSRIHSNAGWGVHIYSEGCQDCANLNVVSSNVIYENAAAGDRGAGIILGSGAGNLAFNNLVWGNSGGIQIDDETPDAAVYNNVIYANGDFGIQIRSGSSNTIVRNNIVYRNEGEAILDEGYGTRLDHNLVGIDPQFVNASANDFHLQSNSPAIDSGVALNAVPYDFDGIPRPRGSDFDIGAFESPFSTE